MYGENAWRSYRVRFGFSERVSVTKCGGDRDAHPYPYPHTSATQRKALWVDGGFGG